MKKKEWELVLNELKSDCGHIQTALEELRDNCNDLLDSPMSEETHDMIFWVWEFAYQTIHTLEELEIMKRR